GIEAVFVITRNTKGYVSISARSHSKINVQRIMEEMGGGGHFNLAAAQVYDQTLEQVKEKLISKIYEEIKES
ncbi:DHHA1 domain-containing protein, partial [Streptococcus suis]